MEKKKITDLEEFALAQIFKPFASCFRGRNEILEYDEWGREKRITKLPMKLDKVLEFTQREENKEWWGLVISRISRCNFYFPDYIQHPLVEEIKRLSKLK